MEYYNFSLYIPDSMELQYLVKDFNVEFLRSETGEDWYQCRELFPAENIKLCFAPDGVIISADYDATALFPDGLSVADVKPNQVPDGFSQANASEWMYKKGAIYAREYTKKEISSQVEYKKSRLMKEANAAIVPLQDAVDLGMSTEGEAAQLLAWKKYRVELSRVTPESEWPARPF